MAKLHPFWWLNPVWTCPTIKECVFHPDYDSGWFLVPAYGYVDKTHNLGTLNTIVYLEVSIHSDGEEAEQSAVDMIWALKTATTIEVISQSSIDKYARILMWKLY